MRIDKVNWITAHIYCKPKCHSFSPSLSWKEKTFGPRHCLTKCALENKVLNQNCWPWYNFFSGEVTSYFDTSYYIQAHILGSMLFRLFVCMFFVYFFGEGTLYFCSRNSFEHLTTQEALCIFVVVTVLNNLTTHLNSFTIVQDDAGISCTIQYTE